MILIEFNVNDTDISVNNYDLDIQEKPDASVQHIMGMHLCTCL